MAELDFSYFQDNLFLAKICDKNDSVMRSNKSAKNQKEDYLKYGFLYTFPANESCLSDYNGLRY